MAFRLRCPRHLCAATLATALGLAAVTTALPSRAQAESAGAKGAQIYCFMRANGNSHVVSWDAAYALIKRQSASLFKTSPEHAAVMITEAVVSSPGTYPDCGRWLGDLFTRGTPSSGTLSNQEGGSATAPTGESGGMTRGDRYGN